jgi:hypothetical protein
LGSRGKGKSKLAGVISALILVFPAIVSALAGWLMGKRKQRAEMKVNAPFRTGRWIVVVFSAIYFGLLSLLAAINASSGGDAVLPISLIVILAMTFTIVPSAVCFFLYFVSFRKFSEVR